MHQAHIGFFSWCLLCCAAKQLTDGQVRDTSIKSAKDLSGNSLANAKVNAANEGVGDKVDFVDESASKQKAPDNSFDAVLSEFVMHNSDSESMCTNPVLKSCPF